ncbi:MAG: hypothetical protein ACRES9_02635 [Gammaproteobacteria bacterium]
MTIRINYPQHPGKTQNIYFPEDIVLRHPDWLNFYIVVASGVLMINIFARVGMGIWAQSLLFLAAALAGDSLGKLAAMYRFSAVRGADALRP